MFLKETPIMKALSTHPRAKDVFKKHGMGCLTCMGAENETIEASANMHGIKVDILLKELNKLLTNEKG